MRTHRRNELSKELQDALESLPEKQRVPLLLSLAGYSYEEISGFLSLSQNTIRGRIARAKQSLKKEFLSDLHHQVTTHKLDRQFAQGIMALIRQLPMRPTPPQSKSIPSRIIPASIIGLLVVIATGLSPEEGWAVGGAGAILHTTDGGENWIQQNSGTRNWLYSVNFVSSIEGWVVGDWGIILHTTDGGENWDAQTNGISYPLNDVYFASSTEGWTTGDAGVILHTADRGENWTVQDSHHLDWLYGVHFVGSTEGWVVGSWGTIVHTTDRGEN